MQGMTRLKQKEDARQHIATAEKQKLAIKSPIKIWGWINFKKVLL